MRRLYLVLFLLLIHTQAATAGVIHHWRFESGGFLDDSVGSADLTNTGVSQVALPGTGRGSDFDLALSNGSAGDFGSLSRTTASLPAAPTGSFTVEFFAHFDILIGPFGDHLLGTATSQANSTIGWSLQARRLNNALTLFTCLASTCDTMASSFLLDPAIDYYVAVVFDQPGGEATFYLAGSDQ